MLEAPILRWLYVRRQPKQTFDIDFGPEVVRLYDEWDALGRKAADPAKRDAPGARLRAGLGDRGRRPAADAAGRRTVPDALVGRRRDRRRRPSRSAGSSSTSATPTTRSTTSSRGCRKAMAWTAEFVAAGRPHDRARDARRRAARRR